MIKVEWHSYKATWSSDIHHGAHFETPMFEFGLEIYPPSPDFGKKSRKKGFIGNINVGEWNILEQVTGIETVEETKKILEEKLEKLLLKTKDWFNKNV